MVAVSDSGVEWVRLGLYFKAMVWEDWYVVALCDGGDVG